MSQGHAAEALVNFRSARRLAGPTESLNYIDAGIALALLATQQFAEAIAQARLAIAEFPPESGRAAEYPWLVIIAAESALGHEAHSHAELEKFLTTRRTLRSMIEIQRAPTLAANQVLLDGLRRAGMPVE